MTDNQKRPMKRDDGWPTRSDIRYDTDAERLCRITLQLVEGMGASEALTNAVVSLDRARNFIADHVEGVDPKDSFPRSVPAKESAAVCEHGKVTAHDHYVYDDVHYREGVGYVPTRCPGGVQPA